MPQPTSYEHQAGHPIAASAADLPQKNDRNAWRRAVESLRDGWMRASAALVRAEQHIMENFRQPPHGG